MKNIMHAVTISGSLNLMKGQIEYLIDKGYEMQLLSSPGEELNSYDDEAIIHALPMDRDINIKNDVISLFKCIKIIKNNKPDLINYGTPKASLLNAIASYLNKVPIRIYKVQGLRYETTRGFKRILLKNIERFVVMLSTDVLIISESMKQKMIEDKIIKKTEGKVLNNGSSNGLNEKYHNVTLDDKKVENIKQELDINNEFIVGFVGRLTNDKGMEELLNVIENINFEKYDLKFVIIGSLEQTSFLSKLNNLQDRLQNRIYVLGNKQNLEYYYNLMHVLLFPTHREGFGNVSIEAQSQGVPVITTDVTGVVDTLQHNITGFICNKGDTICMESYIYRLYNEKCLLQNMSINAKHFVSQNFKQEDIWEALHQYYIDLERNFN